jgi:transglutaminase-like putative cysteine protease
VERRGRRSGPLTYRIRVEHRSCYRYARVVQSSYNEARITPLTTPSQLVLDSRIEVQPAAALHGYADYWGSVVHAFDLQQPHDEMVITGRSVVETSVGRPAGGDALTWDDLHRDDVRDRFAEYLAPTVQVPTDGRLLEVAADLMTGHGPLEAVPEAVAWVSRQLTYVPGATAVHTSAVEAWDGGEGVCQDFAHLTLALLRAMGVPGRYCSGYVHPDGDAEVGQTVAGQSHAWIEHWCGEWEAIDPTAGQPIGEHHVLVARGRDYADVPPVKGIFHGGPTDRLDVSVALTRLA